jgi:hypothetical protein
MRTLLVGLIGSALVFTFFWYRGDVGVITVPILGELTPPAAAQSPAPGLTDRLATVGPEARAIRAEFAPSERLVDLATAPEIYAGQLIAKPRAPAPDAAAVPAPTDEELSGRLTERAMRVFQADAVSAPLALSNALRIANEVGVVDASVGGGAMLINLDYDLMDEVEQESRGAAGAARSLVGRLDLQATVAPDADAAVTRSLGAAVRAVTDARPLAFNAGEAVRDAAMRSQARRLRWAQGACPENVDAAYLRANPQAGVSCAIERLRASGEFEYVEPNLIVTHEMARRPAPPAGVTGPDDPLFAFQWSYRNQGDGEGQSVGGAGFQDFWTRARQQGSRDIVVAVVDTGLDMTHPDIASSSNLAPGVDLVSVEFYANDDDGRDLDPSDPGDICDPSDPTARDSYHGTHVAGTIGAAATNNGDGIAGGAWNVTIVPIRAMGRCGGLQSDINDAIRWAAGIEPAFIETGDGQVRTVMNERPADIINLSLGFRAPSGCPRSTQEAINDAIAAGAIVVAAAGNAGINVDGYGPSGCEGVVTVAAGDAMGALAYYSNWGDKVDIMAPGGDLRVDLDEDGRPDGILSTKRVTDCVDPVTGAPIAECNYAYEHGTSMAAPHVSAAFALLKSQNPTRPNDALISLVVDAARQPRTLAQCTGPCAETPGGTVIDGQPGVCHRPCGQGLLDLSLAVGR